MEMGAGTFHPLGDFLNPALALLEQGLKKSPIGQKLDFANVFEPIPIYGEKKMHKKYSYKLRRLDISHANHVWSTDINYITISGGTHFSLI
jgi:hypothetical protein